MAEELFEVSVQSQRWRPLKERRILFHGINKSGSLVLSETLRKAYRAERRSNQFFSRYRGMPPTDDQFYDLILHSSGHSFFVAHDLYRAVKAPHPGRVLITQLRHPLPRILSVHSWLEKHHPKENGAPLPDLFEWLRRTKGISYSQVEQLGAGFGPDKRELRALPPSALLERAKEALERDFHCIGIAERFEETIFLFAHLCGLPQVPAWKQDQRNAGRPLVSETPQATIDRINETFRWDFELYEFAKRRFEQQLADVRFGPSLELYKSHCIGNYKDRLV